MATVAGYLFAAGLVLAGLTVVVGWITSWLTTVGARARRRG